MNHTTSGGSDLRGPALGLGSTFGYSGADLTNLRTAIARDEVVWQPAGTTEPRTLELRIHGVGGAPPEVNLESPATLQVAGDARAGFYRAWFPGGTARGRPLQEAYCWGHLDTAWWTALWLLLLPFGLLNVAHWALPAVGPSAVRATARALLRLQSLLLTVALVATTCYLTLDLVAWQAAERDLLWAWTGGFENWQLGTRMALMSLGVFAVIGVLWWLSHRTQGDYEDRSSGAGAPDLDIWPLSDRMLWCGALPVTRQRAVHLLAASGDCADDPGPAALGHPGLGATRRLGGRDRRRRRGGRADPVGLDRPRREAPRGQQRPEVRPERGGRLARRPRLHRGDLAGPGLVAARRDVRHRSALRRPRAARPVLHRPAAGRRRRAGRARARAVAAARRVRARSG